MPQTYVFYAGRDFDLKNLKCKKGDQLPERWQEAILVRKLREQYGEKAIEVRPGNVMRKDERKTLSAAPAAPEVRSNKR